MSEAVEELLQRLLTGELDTDSDEARRLFVEHPEARDELDRLRRVEQAVRRSGDECREVLAEVDEAAGAPGEEAVEALVQHHFQGGDGVPVPAARRSGLLRWLVPLAAAAGIVFVIWARPFQYTRVDEPRELTMGVGLRDLFPAGQVDGFGEFRWSSDAAAYHYFRVSVYDPEAPEGSPAIAGSGDLDDPRWNPDPSEVATWPRRILWDVVVYEGGDPVDRSDPVTAWLSP